MNVFPYFCGLPSLDLLLRTAITRRILVHEAALLPEGNVELQEGQRSLTEFQLIEIETLEVSDVGEPASGRPNVSRAPRVHDSRSRAPLLVKDLQAMLLQVLELQLR